MKTKELRSVADRRCSRWRNAPSAVGRVVSPAAAWPTSWSCRTTPMFRGSSPAGAGPASGHASSCLRRCPSCRWTDLNLLNKKHKTDDKVQDRKHSGFWVLFQPPFGFWISGSTGAVIHFKSIFVYLQNKYLWNKSRIKLPQPNDSNI